MRNTISDAPWAAASSIFFDKAGEVSISPSMHKAITYARGEIFESAVFASVASARAISPSVGFWGRRTSAASTMVSGHRRVRRFTYSAQASRQWDSASVPWAYMVTFIMRFLWL